MPVPMKRLPSIEKEDAEYATGWDENCDDKNRAF